MTQPLWDGPNRLPTRRAAHTFQQRAWVLRLHQRLDLPLLIGIILVFGGAIVATFFGVRALEQAGWFDPPIVQPLRDERILTNVRDNLPNRQFTHAVLNPPTGEVVIAQQGGAIHRYDPRTHLWQSETPLSRPDFGGDVTILRSGCGDHPLAENPAACADPNSLWAVSLSGGLARSLNRRWELLIPVTLFAGTDGLPVEHADITAVAISDDQRWLLAGTRAAGVGLYSIPERRWVATPSDLAASLAAQPVTHLAFFDGFFWAANSSGLTRLSLGRRGLSDALRTSVSAPVLDLDVTRDGESLWVLAQTSCRVEGMGCLWLGRFDDAGATAETLISEAALFPELNLSSVRFAQQWPGALVLAGDAGIFRYDQTLHSWSRIFAEPVLTVQPLAGDAGFYFGYSGGAGLETPQGDTGRWPLRNRTIVKIALTDPAAARSSPVYALSDGGTVDQLLPDDRTASFYVPEAGSTDPAEFTDAFWADPAVVFSGPDGWLIHDVARRSYAEIAAAELPGWALDAETRYLASGDTVFALVEGTARAVEIYPLQRSLFGDVAALVASFSGISSYTVRGPLRESWPWPQNAIGVLDASGMVYRITARGSTAQIGDPLGDADLSDLNDLLVLGENLLAAADDGLWTYSASTRDWDSLSWDTDNGVPMELATADSLVVVRSDEGILVKGSAPNAPMIGSETRFSFELDEVSDARSVDNLLYLAGAGQVDQYDTDARRITRQWDLTGAGDVRLAGIIDGKPLAHTGRSAWLAEDEIDPAGGSVLSMALDDDSITMVRTLDGDRYLKVYDADSPQRGGRCFFRNPAAASTTVYDAVLLPGVEGDVVAVAGNRGLEFYRSGSRSWLSHNEDPVTPQRLQIADGYLVLSDTGSDTAVLVPLSSFSFPESCATEGVSFSPLELEATSLAVDEVAGRIVWLDAEGALYEMRNGRATLLLAADGGGPRRGSLRRIFFDQETLYALTEESVWRYATVGHRWTRNTFDWPGREQNVTETNLELGGETPMVTVRTESGAFYVGAVPGADAEVSLLEAAPATPGSGLDGATLLDVQSPQPETWAFVTQSGVQYYDAGDRRWARAVDLGVQDSTLQYGTLAGRRAFVGNQGHTFWIATTTDETPTRFARYDLRPGEQYAFDGDGQIWSLDDDGGLVNCTADGDSYICSGVGPAPITLDPAQVRRAYVWNGIALFDLPDGLMAVNLAENRTQRLPAAATGIAGIREASSVDNELWLVNDSGLLRLWLGSGALRGQWHEGVRSVRRDSAGNIWGLGITGWQWWTRGAFAEADANLIPLIGEQSAPAGYDSAGRLYLFAGGRWQADPRPMPAEVRGRALRAAVADGALGSGGWWLLAGAEWLHLEPSLCPVVVAPAERPAPAALLPSAQSLIGRLSEADPAPTIFSPAPTATPTPIPSPTPTPTPIPLEPCLVVKERGALPDGIAPTTTGILHASFEPRRGFLVVGNDGSAARISRNATPITPDPNLRARFLDDEWPVLQTRIRTMDSGSRLFNPRLELVLRRGALYTARPEGEDLLASNAASRLILPPALDAGWLSWQRALGLFSVNSQNGFLPVTLTPTQFVRNGHLIFEPVDALVALDTDDVRVANSYGIWSYRSADLSLIDSENRYLPLEVAAPLFFAHSLLYSASAIHTLGGSVAPSSAETVSMRLGDATLDEQVRTQEVTGAVIVSGSSRDAFAATGFTWDSERASAAFGPGGLRLLTAAGIHPAATFAGYDEGPPGLTTGDRLLTSPAGTLHAQVGSSYYERTAASWSLRNSNPLATRALVSSGPLLWQKQDGAVTIVLASGLPYSFAVSATGGLSFNSDRLLAASMMGGTTYAMTEAFFESAAGPAQLSGLRATRTVPLPADKLEPLVDAVGTGTLYLTSDGSISLWNSAPASFGPSLANPYLERSVVDSARLRIDLEAGAPVTRVRMEDAAGTSFWQPVTLSAGRFPFDNVTRVAAFGGSFYVGTSMGLQRYAASAGFGLDAMAAFLDLRATRPGALLSVERLGIPAASPDRLLLASGTRCLGSRDGITFAPCTAATGGPWARGATGLWRWTLADGTGPAGRYLSAAGTTREVTLANGRFLHDHPESVAVCGDQPFVQWGGDWATLFSGTSITLLPPYTTWDLAAYANPRLFCLEQTLFGGGTIVAPGLYLRDEGGQFALYENGAWVNQSSAATLGLLRETVERPPVMAAARLRLLRPAPGAGFQFEHRTLAGEWLPLSWEGGSLALDKWENLEFVDGTLWVATPEGFVSMTTGGGLPLLDPDTVNLVRQLAASTDKCLVTDMEQDAPGAPGRIAVRCGNESERVFAGSLSTVVDTGVFRALAANADPFAERVWIDAAGSGAGLWQWRGTGRSNGQPGALQAAFCGSVSNASVPACEDPIGLAAGRFGFDAINSLALPFAESLELATAQSGWYQYPPDDLRVGAIRRSQTPHVEPDQVRHVGITQHAESGGLWLCLRLDDGAITLDAAGEANALDSCPEWAGSDGFWSYALGEQDLEVTAGPRSIGGSSGRRLEQGRFSDDQVVGPPVPLPISGPPAYFLPTRAGVLQVDGELRTQQIYPPPFTGFDEGKTPRAILSSNPPVYAAADGLYTLDAQRQRRVAFAAQPAAPSSAAAGPGAALELGFVDGNGGRWLLLDVGSGSVQSNRLPLNVETSRLFQANRIVWNNPGPQMMLEVGYSQLTVRALAPNREMAGEPLPAGFMPLVLLPMQTRLLLVGQTEILEVDVNGLTKLAYLAPLDAAAPAGILIPGATGPSPSAKPVFVVVSESGTELYAFPGQEARNLGAIGASIRLQVLGQSPDSLWLYVATPEGALAWVLAAAVEVEMDPLDP